MRKLLVCALALAMVAGVTLGADKITLRCAGETSRTDPQTLGLNHFAKYVKEKSGGTIDVKVFPDSALGSSASLINQLKSGSIDFHISGSGNYAGLMPELNAFDVPFLFRDFDHVDKVMDGPIGRAILDTGDAQGIKALALWENGFRSLTNSRNAVSKPADVKGLKIRVPTFPMHVVTWETLGANPVPMDYSEVFTALETKAIEAQDHPITVTFSAKFYEVQKYLSVTHHCYTPLVFAMNKAKFDSLTPEQQKIIMDGALEGAKFQRAEARKREQDCIDKIRDSGLEVVEAKDLNMAEWDAAVSGPVLKVLNEKYPVAAKWIQPIKDTK